MASPQEASSSQYPVEPETMSANSGFLHTVDLRTLSLVQAGIVNSMRDLEDDLRRNPLDAVNL